MIVLLQRVDGASVDVVKETGVRRTGEVARGFLALVCAEPGDGAEAVRKLACMNGNRPSFSGAAGPEGGLAGFNAYVEALRAEGVDVETGEFGAHMRVSLVNDGPATFWLRMPPA